MTLQKLFQDNTDNLLDAFFVPMIDGAANEKVG